MASSYRLSDITDEQYNRLLRRGASAAENVPGVAREICLDVKRRGDAALRDYTARFDGVALDKLRVADDETRNAVASQPVDVRAALEAAAENIRAFHKTQLGAVQTVETAPGVTCWRERRPIERVGLYIPAGSAPLPSTVLMLGIPAILAGCERVVLCSPPQRNGAIHPLVLAAASIVGIGEIYRVGGAQAIAALAYGTESIPKVETIFGPGNRFVTAAKQFVSSQPDGAAIDLLAGPSELLIIADESANASHVAADLLSQAEHDTDSQVVLVTTSAQLARSVQEQLDSLAQRLPRIDILRQSLAKSFIAVADSLEQAVRFSNDYAPEHLIINTESPERLVPQIRNAGSVFLGPFAPVTAGDYASGTNHTLPTGGSARWSSGVSVESFMKTISFQRISKDGLQNLAPTLTALAEAEGLEGHRQAVMVRLK